MPKLPIEDTKQSAKAAARNGASIGRPTKEKARQELAPQARAASITSPGMARRPARSVMKASAVCCTPSSRMMPSRPYIGLAEPGGGASPMDCSSAEDGPKSCSQASAVTCGAIISGSRKATDRSVCRACRWRRPERRANRPGPATGRRTRARHRTCWPWRAPRPCG
jgi:hypothetical protein